MLDSLNPIEDISDSDQGLLWLRNKMYSDLVTNFHKDKLSIYEKSTEEFNNNQTGPNKVQLTIHEGALDISDESVNDYFSLKTNSPDKDLEEFWFIHSKYEKEFYLEKILETVGKLKNKNLSKVEIKELCKDLVKFSKQFDSSYKISDYLLVLDNIEK